MKTTAKSFLATTMVVAVMILFGRYDFLKAQTPTTDSSSDTSSEQPVEVLIPADTPTSSDELIFTTQDLQAEIAEVERTYKGQSAEYRRAEQDFKIAKQQFLNLNTLSSLEAAVQETSQALFTRSQLMETYVTLLRLELLNAKGANVELKEEVVIRLESLQKALRRHKEQSLQAIDRATVNRLADEFTAMVEDIEGTTSFANQLINLAELQTIQDQAVGLQRDLLEDEAQQDSVDTRKIRALEQVDNSLQETDGLLLETTQDFEEDLLDERPSSSNTDFMEIHAKLTQIVLHLDEIVGS